MTPTSPQDHLTMSSSAMYGLPDENVFALALRNTRATCNVIEVNYADCEKLSSSIAGRNSGFGELTLSPAAHKLLTDNAMGAFGFPRIPATRGELNAYIEHIYTLGQLEAYFENWKRKEGI